MQSHFDRFGYEDREQLFLQAEHSKGECVTVANPEWGGGREQFIVTQVWQKW